MVVLHITTIRGADKHVRLACPSLDAFEQDCRLKMARGVGVD